MRLREAIFPVFLFACLVFGGASNGGFLANGVLQLLGAGMLGWVMWQPAQSRLAGTGRFLQGLLLAIAALIALQFVLLPQALWEMPGGRAELAKDGAAIGVVYAPLLWGLLPYEAIKSAMWLVPALALAAAMLRSAWQPQHLAWAIVAAMVLSVLLGALQLGQGKGSAVYFYAFTNWGSTVGFFANSNHLATLLLVSLPFIAAIFARQFKTGPQHLDGPLMAICAGLLLTALTGIVVNGSLAGFGLCVPVLAASAMILVTKPLYRAISLVTLPLIVAGGMTWLVLTPEGHQWLELEEVATSSGSRQAIWAATVQAIGEFFPLGSGLGTFAEVYLRYEDPAAVGDFYINHAHNDYLELALELGLAVVPVILVFLIWWTRRVIQIWTDPQSDPLAFAGAIASAAILIHSIVDYPLRTAAISAVFVVCLCLMGLRARSAKPNARLVPDVLD